MSFQLLSYQHPALFLDPRLRDCVIIQQIVLHRIIFRAKALGYIENSLIIQGFILSNLMPGHVAQGFNPAKADCDTASFTEKMLEVGVPFLRFGGSGVLGPCPTLCLPFSDAQ